MENGDEIDVMVEQTGGNDPKICRIGASQSSENPKK